MGKMSRSKGARGEREAARVLSDYGFDCKRGRQFKGGPDSPDVSGLPGVHIEVKRVERFRLYDALAQAIGDAGGKLLPTVFHRQNDSPWVVVMKLDDWMQLYRAWYEGGGAD